MANKILPFCATDNGTNLLDDTAYAASTDRTSGNKPGVASSKLNNKAIRQSSYVASQLAQIVADKTGADVDDLNDAAGVAAFLSTMKAALVPLLPVSQFYTATGANTYSQTFYFFITSGSATAAATYTNNGNTYTVVETVASGTMIKLRGTALPQVSGTLTKSGGTGDTTLTFQAYRTPTYIDVKIVGAGGGGGGSCSSAANAGAGGAGGNSTFASTVLVAGGGSGGGANSSVGGTGGTVSLTTPAVRVIQTPGSCGSSSGHPSGGSVALPAGSGGVSFFGGSGAPGALDATANSGSGGGGGAASFGGFSGAGGGAGGFLEALILSPSPTYAISIGTKGTAGTAGTSGVAGGAGGDGYCSVVEYYQ